MLGVHISLFRSCSEWFCRFKNGDLSAEGRLRSGQTKEFEDKNFADLLDEDPSETHEWK